MEAETISAFAEEWIAAWNALDVERVLAFYTDDFEMSSPLIAKFADEPSGTLHGKPAIRDYWTKAVQGHPGLHFTLERTYVGANSIILAYTNESGRRCGEIFFFNAEGKIFRSAAHSG